MKRLLVKGTVQGVGFRPFIYRLARRYGLKGYVRNLGDAGVEIVAAGDDGVIARFTEAIVREKVKNARIDDISVLPPVEESEEGFEDFTIISSGGLGAPGIIPPDSAVCDACIEELFDPENTRRYFYAFTSCVDCGSRLSTIHALPYDRPNTSLGHFPMCDDCRTEYDNPEDRRLHYQGIACSRCGPRYSLHDGEGNVILFKTAVDMVREAAAGLRRGNVLAIKGVTGTHIACTTTDEAVLGRFRKTFGRPEKPFAIMVRSIDTAETFAHLSPGEKETLQSPARPIVLLRLKADSPLPGKISPGLHTIGVMLPYAGIHHLIFRFFDEPLVMTSANFPGQPMLTDNGKILERLRGVVDFFLLHDLDIENRCDDSVLRFAGRTPLFIRRSRGYAPSQIRLPFEITKTILCLGSELNNTVCLCKGNEAYLSQYVGDTTHVETLAYMDRAVKTLLDMTRTKPGDVDAVCVDLNPAFDIRRYGETLAGRCAAALQTVQHHMAHLGSLIGERGGGDMAAITIDGIGYGSDGKAWGGEIFTVREGKVERRGCLKEQRMPGGDAATMYPPRMLAGILYDRMGPGVKDLLMRRSDHFRHGTNEIAVLTRQLEKNLNVVRTTSCGRVLDALSALLGICCKRTYDGEPAMKLEAAATQPAYEIPVKIQEGILDTTEIVAGAARLLEEGKDPGKIAASCQAALAAGLARMAMDEALRLEINVIGLSGGVAYNEMIHTTIRQLVEKGGFTFVTNTKVPCGDGGIAFGQAIVAACMNGWIKV